MVVM
jgi:site-specific recombinase XerC